MTVKCSDSGAGLPGFKPGSPTKIFHDLGQTFSLPKLRGSISQMRETVPASGVMMRDKSNHSFICL